ncbi:MAG: alpha/beta hydrolase [Candidatus Hydrogenedentes bacterium]|nr:alpha/beta hydrolase [Candidatus Hydrogenedentota bacterium]
MSTQQLEWIVARLRERLKHMPKSVEESRTEYETYTEKLRVGPDVQREPVNADGVPAHWVCTPNAREERTILYLHGGGYILGSTTTHLSLIGNIARACEARCLSVDYRLAPEAPHPAALEDATAAYLWLLKQGVAPEQIILMGDSAGGGLSAATLAHLREQGLPLPAAAVLLSPWVDLEATGESAETRAAEDPLIVKRGIQIFARLYLGGKDTRTPLAAPLYADLHGLPPVLIQVGTAEVLLDDSTRLAARLQESGVRMELRIYDGMIHVWQMYAGLVDEADAAIAEIGAFAAQHWPS